MGEDSKSARTQIIIAVIGLVGVLGTALITQWKDIFPQTPKDNAGIAHQSTTPAQQTTPLPITPAIDNKPTVADAERMTARFLEAFQKRDTNSIVQMISVPFFFIKGGLAVSKDEMRTAFESMFRDEKER